MPKHSKRLFILLLLIFFGGHFHAQSQANQGYQARRDSLQRELIGSQGEERIAILLALSGEISFSNPTKSFRLAEEARELARNQQLSALEADALRNMGIARAILGWYSDGLQIIFEEIEMRKTLNDLESIAIANNNLGFILREQKNYDLALEYFSRTLHLTESEVDYPNLRAVTLNNIGQIHRAMGDLTQAVAAHEQSLEVLRTVPNSAFARANNLNNLGEIYMERQQYDQALVYLHVALTLERQLGNPIREAEALNHLAEAHLGQGRLDSARHYAQMGLAIASPLENQQQARDLNLTAAKVYAASDDFRTAYTFQARHSFLNDSLHTTNNEQQVEALKNQFLTAQAENDSDLQKERNARAMETDQRALLGHIASLVGVLLILLLVGLLLFTFRMRAKAHRELTAQKEAVDRQRDALELANQHLQKVNHEMDNFMYRVSHDLRSPLSSLMGLITLASDEKDPLKRDQYLGLMNKSVGKLDSFIQDIIDLTRNNRQQVRYSEVVLKPLFEEYFEQYRFHDGRKDIACELEMKGMDRLVTDQYRLGIIIGNLISNAVIYAKDYREDAVIKITTQVNEERAIIQIRDNGPGIAKDHQERIFEMFFRSSNTTNGSGLGLYIVRETIEKLGGHIRVVSQLRHGATFIVEIPNQKLGTESQPPTTNLSQVLNA